jgi:predicted RNA-binding protein with EMAP domain
MITIKRTEENTLEFYKIKHLQEQNKNHKLYLRKIIEHATSEKQVMQKLLKQHEKRQASLDEKVAFHQQTFVENIDDLMYLRNVIENLKERLINIGEESAVREIMSGEEKVPNEE